MTGRRTRLAAWIAVASGAWNAVPITGPILAQTVEVRVREDSTRRLVPGAIVRLLGQEGVVALGLSDGVGRIVLTAPAPGSYRLRADRIGHRGTETGTFVLAVGEQARYELLMPVDPVVLPDVVAVAPGRCSPEPAGDTPAAVVWEEIRKALAATRITEEHELAPLRVTLIQRRLTPWGAVLEDREEVLPEVRGVPPFVSPQTAEVLEHGFVRLVGDSVEYSGPDAATLLHDDFVRAHCFHIVRSPDGLIGLAFGPIPNRCPTGIAGTLWLEPTTHELRWLDFRYTQLPWPWLREELGGRVEFRRLPYGAWIVSSWRIRTPLIGEDGPAAGRRAAAQRPELVGFMEHGGRAEPVESSLAAGEGELRPPAILTGTVFDSVAGTPLNGAVVRVEGQADSTVTGPHGAFRLEVTRGEERLVSVRHPRLGLLPDRSTQRVVFAAGAEAALEVAVPSLATFRLTRCPPESRPAGLIGQVFDRDGTPLEGVAVEAAWNETAARVTRWGRAQGVTDPRGLYVLCDLPPGHRVTIAVVQPGQALRMQNVVALGSGFTCVDLRGRR